MPKLKVTQKQWGEQLNIITLIKTQETQADKILGRTKREQRYLTYVHPKHNLITILRSFCYLKLKYSFELHNALPFRLFLCCYKPQDD